MRAGKSITVVELADEHKAPLSFTDAWKRFFLGKPLINEDLEHESLSNPIALGALSPDAVSSTAYGPEQILIELETSKEPERAGRALDHETEDAFERLRGAGYL